MKNSTDPSLPRMRVGSGILSCTQDVQWTELAPNPDQSSELTTKYNIFIADIPGFNRDEAADKWTDPKILQEIWLSLHEKCVLPPDRER